MGRQASIHGMTALVLLATTLVSTSCATRKFTRNELTALETDLSVRLDTNEKNIANLANDAKEMSAHIAAVEKTTKNNASDIANVKGDVTKVDARVTEATNSARNAQSAADRANTSLSSLEKAVSSLDERFRNRNDYELVAEKQILFKFSSSALGEDFEAPLTEVAMQLKENSDMFVVLEGRTDSVGDAAYNIELGEKRNDSVTRYLIVTQGVPTYKVFQTSFGKEQPIAANDSKEGREKNRSVVLRVYRAKSAAATAR